MTADRTADRAAAGKKPSATIGVLRERKDGERRVTLTPRDAGRAVAAGHRVLVETGAGVLSGHPDEAYQQQGAEIVGAEAAWDADLTVKVKEPQPDEYRHLTGRTVLFGFLHLAAEPQLAAALTASGATAYAYEDHTEQGRRTILEPMSHVAGRVAAITGPHLLSTVNGGTGILPGGVPGATAGRAVIIGMGAAGTASAMSLAGIGMHVTGVDIDRSRLETDELRSVLDVRMTPDDPGFAQAVAEADLLIGAALSPGRRAPVVVRREQVATMRPGSVIVDIAVDQGGCIETTRPTSHSRPTYVEAGVIHYCVPNMPGQYPVTATEALSSAAVTPILHLAAAAASGRIGSGPEGYDPHGSLAVHRGELVLR